MRLTISLDDELVKRIDDFTEKNYMSRSGFISLACNQYLNNAQAVDAVKVLSLAMSKIADKGEIDEETKSQLEDFSRLASMLYGGLSV